MQGRVRLAELARSDIPDVRAAVGRSDDPLAVAREGQAQDPLLGQVEGELAVAAGAQVEQPHGGARVAGVRAVEREREPAAVRREIEPPPDRITAHDAAGRRVPHQRLALVGGADQRTV
jgi:hypothetical protein